MGTLCDRFVVDVKPSPLLEAAAVVVLNLSLLSSKFSGIFLFLLRRIINNTKHPTRMTTMAAAPTPTPIPIALLLLPELLTVTKNKKLEESSEMEMSC